MKFKRFWSILLSCILVLSCIAVPVGAVEAPTNNMPILRVSGRINQTISANSIASMSDSFSLDVGDIVKYDCTYTPKSASVDFGVIAPDGLFYSLNSTSGSINKSISVTQRGQYTLAIRNNASYAVTVTGTVKY